MQGLRGHGQRDQHLDDFVVGARGLDDQAFFEAARADVRGHLARADIDALHHAATLELGARDLVGDGLQAGGQLNGLFLHFLLERIVGPELLERHAARHEGMGVAAEGAVMLGRLPDIVLLLDQQRGKGQAEARQRFRLGDHVGLDARFLDREIRARTAAARLDVVDDEERAVLFSQLGDALHPFDGGRVEAAFALDRLEDEGRGRIDARRGILERHLDLLERVDAFAEGTVVGHVGHAAKAAAAVTGARTLRRVAGQ